MHLPVGPARVYSVIDSDDGRASFWAESAVERDGEIHFRFSGGFSCTGRILERASPRVFALEYLGGIARFDLTPDGKGGTDLELTHSGIPAEEWQEVHAGWLNVLFPLKAWVVHGVDLRNHDPARAWSQGYADQ